MYNKLFGKILDSSIWLAPDSQRLVWITLLAAMDEDSNAMFACAENLAARARVSLVLTEEALVAFQSPDPKDPDQQYEGRRIERIPGGWYVLNGPKYRAIVTRSVDREQTRIRVQRWREKHGKGNALRNAGNAKKPAKQDVTDGNVTVTTAEAYAEAEAKRGKRLAGARRAPPDFLITDELRAWAIEHAPLVNVELETAKFRDWEFKRARSDWPAAWRNWLRDAQSKAAANSPHTNSASEKAEEAWLSIARLTDAPAERTPAMSHAIEAVGGWQAIRMRTTHDGPRIKRDFVKAYTEHKP